MRERDARDALGSIIDGRRCRDEAQRQRGRCLPIMVKVAWEYSRLVTVQSHWTTSEGFGMVEYIPNLWKLREEIPLTINKE